MENIYGQTEQERNSIVQIPDGLAERSGNTLYSWLGSLWRSVHKGDGMIRGLQSARGIRLAQLYIDVLESLKLQDRNGAPVFHRELWHPIVVRLSEADTAQENMIAVGMDGNVGPQPAGSVYGEGTVFSLGRLANFKDYVTYPVDPRIAGGALSIVDNMVNPTVLMERGKDYEIRNGSIIFHRDNDPLGDRSAFDRYDVPGIVDEDGKLVSDMETVLWASDVLVDRSYVADHLSYVLGASAPSSDVVKRIVNAAWSCVASGLTPELAKTLVAAMLNVPVVQDEKETVLDVFVEKDDDGSDVARIVRTDKCAYRVSMKATLREAVRPGAVLSRGDLLDESVRIYPYMNRVSATRRVVEQNADVEVDVRGGTGYSTKVEIDIPSVVIPSSMIRARTEHGVYAMWGEEEVKKDKNGRLYFDVGGTDDDVAAFWEDVWARADETGVDMKDIVGPEGTKVSPAAFFLRNLVGANTLFVVVDRSQIDDASLMRNPMFFDMLSSVVPSAIRLFLVEHRAVGDGDEMDMAGAAEDKHVAAALPEAADLAAPSGEMVSVRFFRPPPAHVRGAREEESRS